jgi:hypothetical protein
MALTKLFELVKVGRDDKVWRTYRTEQECLDYLASNDLADYMGTLTLTIRPIWTNMGEASIKRLVGEKTPPTEEGDYL